MTTFANLTRSKLVSAVVDLDGERVVFQFNANGLTLGWANRWEKTDDNELLAGLLLEILVGWDVVTDDGTPDPLSRDHLLRLPAWALREIQEAVSEAAAPSRAEGNASSGLSSTPVSASVPLAETHPNGADGSPSPTPSTSPSLT